MSSAYQILGLQNGASMIEIKKAYRRLVLQYHPDRNPSNSNYFIKIQEAYQYLINEKNIQKNVIFTTKQNTYNFRKVKQEEVTIDDMNFIFVFCIFCLFVSLIALIGAFI